MNLDYASCGTDNVEATYFVGSGKGTVIFEYWQRYKVFVLRNVLIQLITKMPRSKTKENRSHVEWSKWGQRESVSSGGWQPEC